MRFFQELEDDGSRAVVRWEMGDVGCTRRFVEINKSLVEKVRSFGIRSGPA